MVSLEENFIKDHDFQIRQFFLGLKLIDRSLVCVHLDNSVQFIYICADMTFS